MDAHDSTCTDIQNGSKKFRWSVTTAHSRTNSKWKKMRKIKIGISTKEAVSSVENLEIWIRWNRKTGTKLRCDTSLETRAPKNNAKKGGHYKLYWLQGRGGNDRDRQTERERLETVKHYALSIRRKAHKTNQSNARIMATEWQMGDIGGRSRGKKHSVTLWVLEPLKFRKFRDSQCSGISLQSAVSNL